MQSSSQIVTPPKPTRKFLQAGCPSCRPTNTAAATATFSFVQPEYCSKDSQSEADCSEGLRENLEGMLVEDFTGVKTDGYSVGKRCY